jgi:hypothetical protein
MTDRRPWFAGAPPLGQVLAQTAVQVLVAMLAAAAAFAHPLSPALLELLERPDGRVDVVWRTSTVQVPDADFAPELPAECTVAGPPEASADERYATVRWVAECGAGGLVGRRVAIRGLASAQTDALVRVQLRDGRVLQTVLRKGSPAYVVPARPLGQPIDESRRLKLLAVAVVNQHVLALDARRLKPGDDRMQHLRRRDHMWTPHRVELDADPVTRLKEFLPGSGGGIGVRQFHQPPLDHLIHRLSLIGAVRNAVGVMHRHDAPGIRPRHARRGRLPRTRLLLAGNSFAASRGGRCQRCRQKFAPVEWHEKTS